MAASMGPPEFTGGNALTCSLSGDRRRRASMGPPEFTGGNSIDGGTLVADARASMGPPEFTGGNTRIFGWRFTETPMLQWGRRNSPAETPPLGHPWALRDVRASMGPPEFTGGNTMGSTSSSTSTAALQWGRRNSPAETGTGGAFTATPRQCFNGAAGIHRRKPVGGPEAADPVSDAASMGPPEFTGGNSQLGLGDDTADTWRFNGAAGIHRRKLALAFGGGKGG